MLLNLYCISAKKVDMANSKKTSTPVAFADIVGQDELKHALMSVVVNKSLDGLLIQGEKGTAKSTTVRALRAILPEQRVITECPYGCPPHRPSVQCADCQERINPTVESRPVPLITLPLGATRERVVGSLSVEAALEGESEFNPGLLAAANRGLLYIDEVNLLDDHLVDVILDAAASGENRVERDGVSVTHPASFTLIGTMNPEEGDLRPQLKDRFALQATVSGLEEIPDRVDVIEQALQSDRETETETGTGTGTGLFHLHLHLHRIRPIHIRPTMRQTHIVLPPLVNGLFAHASYCHQ
ncbi:MAG: Mg-chelatase subunit ChlI [Haloquadratum walsbyi J07HQW1]|uniref:Mg-chelatase subunit ChlI n=1 Tax=Haloquadratum walsbyi J07HQW1 TaxID=1238424 RepID=U1PIG5_9EURY|nr:MAG: Mg-chelatase subunit ChlI [Haloquadratum walsbyi J07HQW1]